MALSREWGKDELSDELERDREFHERERERVWSILRSVRERLNEERLSIVLSE